MKRLVSLFTVLSLVIGLTGTLPVSADYSDDDGLLTWDFAEFAAEISGDNAEYADAAGPIAVDYNGLALSIEKQSIVGRSDIDKISTAGIHWAGKANGNRYAAYTPPQSGTLTVTGSNVGISKSKSGTTLGTSLACEAGTTYYIIAPSKAGTASRITFLYDSAEESTPTPAPNGKYMHISFDDVYSCLKDITNSSYTSVFENSFLADLKRLHDSYGAVFTLNCFDAYSKDTSYDISSLPDTYAQELKDNADWLKFAFHAYDDLTQYTSTEVSGRTNRTAEQAAEDYTKFKNAILTASGNNEASIDTVTRLGFFAGDSDRIDALKEQGITGLLTADDIRISYYFDEALNNTVNQSGTYFDAGKKLKLLKSQTRLESVKNTSSTLEGLRSASGDMLEIFTHEAEYKGNVPARLEAYVKWGYENGYTFGYAMDMDFGREEPEPSDDGIYKWDFSKFTTEISGDNADYAETSSPIAVEYDGLTLSIEKQSMTGRTDIDRINTNGTHWSGKANGNRYVAYTPTETGKLNITADANVGIVTSKTGTSTAKSVTVTASDIGKTYYITSGGSGTVRYIEYITDRADVTVTATAAFNNMYGSNMLLQRGKPIHLDGTAENADSVEISLTKDGDDSYVNKRTAAVSGGRWSVELDAVTLPTAEDYRNAVYTITATPISSDEKTVIEPTVLTNIKIGDLYLVAGQSNTKFYLNVYLGLDYNENELESNENIRLMQEPTSSEAGDSKGQIVFVRKTFQDKLAVAANWQQLTPEYAKTWEMPALTYSLSTELFRETGVPIGVLGTGYGGTEIALWRADNTRNTWYASRIHPLRNFEISGIFWYQGCNDKGNGYDHYVKNMRGLVNEYRSLFGNDKLPFYYVQLARNGNVPELNSAITAGGNDDTTGMKDVRRAQFDVYANAADTTNFGIVSTLDIYGQKDYAKTGKDQSLSARYNYHTGQKPVIAHRLAAWALKDIYGMDSYSDSSKIYTHGPLYKSHYTDGNKLIVEFETTGGLRIMDKSQYADHITEEKIASGKVDPGVINEFEIAEANGEYKTASAQIDGNKLILTAEGVESPAWVRYAYSPYPESPNLTDESGLPAYAFTAEKEVIDNTMKFDFGTGAARDGFVRVDKDTEYSADNGYGFLGISEASANYTKVVDGWYQDKDNLTVLTEGDGFVKSDNKQRPIRFAVKAEPNTYYRVKVTMSAQGGNADITLDSERRHLVLTHESLASGGRITKEFTAAVHNVKWKNRDSGKAVEESYTDDMLNIAVVGANAALETIEIEQIAKPKTLWIFGDSTVTDHYTDAPYSSYVAETGWGAAAAKYVMDDVAVVNLSEGGLSTSNTDYFNVGKDDIGKGDVVIMQMGHNDKSADSYKSNLDHYVNAAKAAGATFVLCSPIQRLENSESVNDIYTPAAKEYAEAKGIAYIDLNALTGSLNFSLGTTGAWYTHVAYWQEGTTVTSFRDPTHLNDFGADNTCRMVMERLADAVDGIAAETLPEAIMPSESVMKDSSGEMRMPPVDDNNEAYPYPGAVSFEHEVELSDVTVEDSTLVSVKISRNVKLPYITVFADIYGADGQLSAQAAHRLEPSGADTSETVSFAEDGLSIPANGRAVVYVCYGGDTDGTLDKDRVLSEEYEIKGEVKEPEYIEPVGGYADKVTIEKVTDTDGTRLVITPKQGELNTLKLFAAVYNGDALKSVSMTTCTAQEDGGVIVPVIEPQLETGESCKLMLWDNEQSPLIEAISFFE